jgi:hypothetical protein
VLPCHVDEPAHANPLAAAAFLARFGTQPGRNGGASAAVNANIPFAIWA